MRQRPISPAPRRLGHRQRQARREAASLLCMAGLMFVLALLSAIGAVALYPVAVGETAASVARQADASTLATLLTGLALTATIATPVFVGLAIIQTRRF